MAYNSPFDTLITNSAKSWHSLEYSGTLNGVLSDVATLSSDKTFLTKNPEQWAFQPPRIIMAVLNYKIQNSDSLEIQVLLKEAIDTALRVYSDPISSAKSVDKLKYTIKDRGLETLLTNPLYQPSDSLTWSSTHPIMSQKTTNQLVNQTQFNDVLFIALAYGGVAPGMDVYLRYCDASRQAVIQYQ